MSSCVIKSYFPMYKNLNVSLYHLNLLIQLSTFKTPMTVTNSNSENHSHVSSSKLNNANKKRIFMFIFQHLKFPTPTLSAQSPQHNPAKMRRQISGQPLCFVWMVTDRGLSSWLNPINLWPASQPSLASGESTTLVVVLLEEGGQVAELNKQRKDSDRDVQIYQQVKLHGWANFKVLCRVGHVCNIAIWAFWGFGKLCPKLWSLKWC